MENLFIKKEVHSDNEKILEEWLDLLNKEDTRAFALLALKPDGNWKVLSLNKVQEHILRMAFEEVSKLLNERRYSIIINPFKKINGRQKIIQLNK